jgi:hypothetical protein
VVVPSLRQGAYAALLSEAGSVTGEDSMVVKQGMNWKSVVLCLAALLAILLLWQQVFVMTGLLWWNAPRAVAPVTPPSALAQPHPDTNWVDLQAYQNTHPEWNPR